MNRDDLAFIEQWHARIADALDEALAWLAAQDRSLLSDGILGDWVGQLRTFQFAPRHVPAIVALIRKRDPHLKEAGIQLAARALEQVDCAATVEPALAETLVPGVDSWVLQALVDLLRGFIGPRGPLFTTVYRALVTLAPDSSANADGIHRNRYIAPLRELLPLYEQHALQTLTPTERDRVLLPILEARHGTRGWRPTVVAILASMGLDAAHHFRVLGERLP